MASSRKKQDEKNLKTLRELGMIPENKYCFDCGQRGPTYVNVTIGSFVCTKCSGMLRGLTPPHRVKSISMATFTSEEVELLRSRGNEYCRRVWLGLHGSAAGGRDTAAPTPNANDEHAIRDFMVEKYERRRYYLEPSKATAESKPSSPSPPNLVEDPSMPPQHKPIQHRPAFRRHAPWTRPDPGKKGVNNNNVNVNGHLENGFAAEFNKADIFGGAGEGENNVRLNGFVADFDNNPVFNGTNTNSGGVSAASSNSSINSAPMSTGSTPMSSVGSTPLSVSSTPIVPINNSGGAVGSPWTSTLQNGLAQPAVEDKYAALKDLDEEIRSQKGGTLEWGVATSTAVTGSQCQQGTALFGTSPVQVGGQPFAATFPEATAAPANPFGGAPWPGNPFKMNGVAAPPLFHPMVNGFAAPAPAGIGGGAWPPPANPFKVCRPIKIAEI
nr:unnamed protein product [Callosobruchus chinensis]